MNVLFWGSSQLSVPFLEILYKNKSINSLAVITTPDKPQGRGLKVSPTPVKLFAQQYKIDTIVVDDIKNDTFQQKIAQLNPELSIVVSYGKIIPLEVIKLHKIGMLNIHFSLLPKYRGAAPIHWTLLNGDNKTGVTIFWLDEGMDTGDIFLQKEIEVTLEDDYFSLSKKLVSLGGDMLNEVLIQISNGKILKTPQQGEISYAPMIKKEMAIIDWDKPAFYIHNLVRAFVHWPKATTTLNFSTGGSVKVKILQTQVEPEKYNLNLQSGTVVKVCKDYLLVLCGNNSLIRILKLQPENRNVLTAAQFICGYRVKQNDRFI